MKNKIKELSKEKEKLIEKGNQIEEKIKEMIYSKLIDFYENEPFIWKIEIGDSEFLIIDDFGSLEFDDILRLSKIFKAEGYELYNISDTFGRDEFEKGLILYFKETEENGNEK